MDEGQFYELQDRIGELIRERDQARFLARQWFSIGRRQAITFPEAYAADLVRSYPWITDPTELGRLEAMEVLLEQHRVWMQRLGQREAGA